MCVWQGLDVRGMCDTNLSGVWIKWWVWRQRWDKFCGNFDPSALLSDFKLRYEWATCSQAFAFHRIAVNVIRDFLAQTAALSRLIFRPFFSSGGGCLMRWRDKFSNIQGSNGKFFFTEEDSNRWQMDAFSVNYFVHFCWTVFMIHDWDLSHSIHTRRSN
jgi:hypothetical protein